MKDKSRITRHRLPLCKPTGLARYRDRHQARQGAAVPTIPARHGKVTTFACPECCGFHLENLPQHNLTVTKPAIEVAASLHSGPRRYILVDIENLMAGSATRSETKALWGVISRQTLEITPNDHVVIGGNRYVAKKFFSAVAGPNIKWVVGPEGPDGADRALLAAINLHRVAKQYDELVIMSGDHAFTDLARSAKGHGLVVHVLTTNQAGRASSLSRKLAAVADFHTAVRLSESTREDRPGVVHPAVA